MIHLSWLFTQSEKQLLQPSSELSHTAKRLSWAFIGFGILLRVAQYLANRSLWLDESYLALNIIHRTFSELLQPLDHGQGAPLGFLMLERLAVYALGNNEYALRLFPLLSGITSLFLFYKVSNDSVNPKAVPIAVGLFALLDPSIYYSSEVKQYSSDVTMGLLLYVIAIQAERKNLNRLWVILLGVAGAIIIWFSHAAIFILAGLGVNSALIHWRRREWAKVGRVGIVGALWLFSFAAFYFISLGKLISNEGLQNYWASSFMPFPPSSFQDLKWFVRTFFDIFERPVGLSFPGLAALTFLVGGFTLFSERRQKFYGLSLPIFVALLASALHQYPFQGRFLLFIVPLLVLFIAEGAAQIREQTRANTVMIGNVLIGLLFFHPVYFAGHHLIIPRTNEEINPAMSYIRENFQEGDVIYLYYASQFAFEYYAWKYNFNKNDCYVGISSRENLKNYVDDLNKLRGSRRVWFLFSHVFAKDGVNEERFFLHQLDMIGTRLDAHQSQGAAAYLYDLKM